MSEQQVEDAIRAFLRRCEKGAGGFTPQTNLYTENGLALDSLETAELAATLEDELGADPFSGGEMPETVADIVAFYTGAAAVLPT